MQYQVPQFIEIEDKIFGPLTLKQFIYLAGAGGICLIFFTLFPFFLFVILAIPVASFGAALAFYEVNGRPLIVAIEHAFGFTIGSKLYLWKQREATAKPTPKAAQLPESSGLVVPTLSESRLRDLAWSLNIKDRTQMGVHNEAPSGFEI